ncbi:MAG: metallophosphoesterase [Clostridia bacterium]|nr:metallophosphoesterase [Clostridia bacterium]
MSIYTIGDLHLSFKENKPMSIFGQNWENHVKKISNNWNENVKDEDLVVLVGDLSWAMYLKDTDEDFKYLCSLPGKKLLLKGNHDYWWTTVTSMKKYLEDNKFKDIDFLYNNSYEYQNYIIIGTRGWSQGDDEESKKLVKREAMRLELSIKSAIEKYGTEKELIAFMHYPPISNINIRDNKVGEFIEILQKYNIKKCYYGHLHGNSINEAIDGEHFGIEFKLVSADRLDFKLLKIKD